MPANRDKSGRFGKGNSGNPSGRPKKLPELTARCREVTPQIVTFWIKCMEKADKELKRKNPRVAILSLGEKCSKHLANYGNGMPPQSIHMSGDKADPGPVRITVTTHEGTKEYGNGKAGKN